MSQPWETAHIFHIRSGTETHCLIAPTKVSPSRWFRSLTHGKPKLWVDLAARVLWSVAERDLWKILILGKANSAEEPTDSLLPFTPSKEPFTSYQNSKGTDILTTPPTHNQTLSERPGVESLSNELQTSSISELICLLIGFRPYSNLQMGCASLVLNHSAGDKWLTPGALRCLQNIIAY